tara:strand:+ start:130 stop:651 length:522 start_codon:yes stop_codon:yes gene_type:complete
MKLLTIDSNGKLEIIPELLGISPFSEMWSQDKTKSKEDAYNNCKYIWYVTDYDSPYFAYSEEDRHKHTIVDVLKDPKFKPSPIIKKAIEKYKELNYSPAIEAVEAGHCLMRSLTLLFKTVNLLEVNNPKTITDMYGGMPKMVESLNQAKTIALKEMVTGERVRGNQKLNIFAE